MTSDINNLISHCLLFTMALKGMEPAPNLQWGGSKNSKGAHIGLLCQHKNMKGNDSNCPR